MARRAERRRRRAEKARAGEAQPAAADGARKVAPPVRATRTQRLIPFVLLGAGLYAFHNSFYGPFIFDDRYSILVNPTIRRLWPPWTALSPPSTVACPVAGRPIVNLSLAVNYALGGLDVRGYHAFNLAIHLLSALLLFGVVRRTLLSSSLRGRYGDQAPWLAMAVALLWTVHPLQTESVTYVIQRTELLVGLFFLLTLYCAIRGVDSVRPHAWYAAAVVACALGAGSKEVMVAAPLLVLLYDRVFLSRSLRDAFRRRGGLYAGLAASWLILFGLLLASPRPRAVAFGSQGLRAWDYAATECSVILHYLQLALWPHPLVVDYDDWPIATTPATVLLPAAAMLSLLGAAIWGLRRRPPLGFLGAWFFLILAPTSSFLPVPTEIAAERRMYLPLAATCVLAIMGGEAALRHLLLRERPHDTLRRYLGVGLLVATVAVLAQVTVRRNEDYRSAFAIWNDAVSKRPNNVRARLNLGDYFFRQGQIAEAREQLAAAVRLAPGSADAQYALALTLEKDGAAEDAIGHYSEALRLRPSHVSAHVNLGIVLQKQGKLGEAMAHYSEALRVDPNHAGAHYDLATALSSLGRTDEALAQYDEAVRLDAKFAQAEWAKEFEALRRGKGR
ncbi:MAG: tetratricopeptide repeat protein [Deltaproteobacteria bacterium]|nr:MAG: tetratricopeptide repeat protein [Deltaproteobacteria bacterium]